MRATLILLMAASAWGQSTWTMICGSGGASCGTTPREVLYAQNRHNPVNGKMLLWMSSPPSNSIYMNSFWDFNPAGSPYFNVRATTGTTTEVCPADTPTAPGDRHPLGQWWVDTIRNRVMIMGGTCMGAGALRDMGYASLSPSTFAWTYFDMTSVAIPHYTCGVFSGDNIPCSNGISASIYHDTDVDMYVIFGSDGGSGTRGFYVYCPTDLNPTPGTLTTIQANSGCGTSAVVSAFGGPVADAWVELSTNYSTQPTVVGGSGLAALPQHSANLIYDPVNKLGVLIALNNANTAIEVWMFDASTLTWTKRTPTGATPAISVGGAGPPSGNVNGVTAAASIGGAKVWYHAANSSASPDLDFVFDITANTWTALTGLGGPTSADSIVYIPGSGKLYAAADPTIGGGATQMWSITANTPAVHGVFGAGMVSGGGIVH